jgi:hypothetical protein
LLPHPMSAIVGTTVTARISTKLRKAERSRRVVRLHRASFDAASHSAEGFVSAVGPELVLLQVIDPAIVLDGYSVLRIADVSAIDESFESADFILRALRLREQIPRWPRAVRLDGVQALIESVARQFPLITLHRERTDEGCCWIGRVRAVDDSAVTIDYITPSARWDGQERYELDSLTRIDFGGRYEEALALVAGTPLGRRRK